MNLFQDHISIILTALIKQINNNITYKTKKNYYLVYFLKIF